MREPSGPTPAPEQPGQGQRWPHRHPILTSVAVVIIGVFLIAAIFGQNTTTKTVTSTDTQTLTQTVTSRQSRVKPQTVVRRPPAQTVTVTSTTTTTVTTGNGGGNTGPGAPGVEGPGSTSHATDSQFCSTHACIPNFPNGNGAIVQCADGEWSHSGGLSGACSDHGGVS